MAMLPSKPPEFSPRMVRLLARIEEFRGAWRATGALPPPNARGASSGIPRVPIA